MTPVRVPFVKMEGCGNDYIYVDAIDHSLPMERAAELARLWSRRHFGIGADGLIALARGSSAPLRMLMWNADGSRAEMCGNGLRCLARFARVRGHSVGDEFAIETDAGVRCVQLLANGDVLADMGDVTVEPQRTVEVDGLAIEITPGNAGNPHGVVFVDDLDQTDVGGIGAALQSHSLFPAGVNIEFVQQIESDRIRQRTFERGSGETLACGTGAAVAALAARQRANNATSRTYVDLRGGTLIVIGKGPSLAIEGPARTVFEGDVEL